MGVCRMEMGMRRGRRRAFTLIELLVVIAIIAILAAILFPVFAQAREKARQAACFANIKQLGIAFTMYAQDYDESLPMWHYARRTKPQPLIWYHALKPYVKNRSVYVCPSDQKTQQSPATDWGPQAAWPEMGKPWTEWISYGYNEPFHNGHDTGSGTPGGPLQMAEIDEPAAYYVVGDCSSPLSDGWCTPTSGLRLFRIAWPHRPVWWTDVPVGAKPETLAALEKYARHLGGSNLAFADGHARWLKSDRLIVAPTSVTGKSHPGCGRILGL
jgi:prepilin-type N-terminal cleavage/methylation domain-containing protein/prepilin-type processing-associated H-X9-DG protein